MSKYKTAPDNKDQTILKLLGDPVFKYGRQNFLCDLPPAKLSVLFGFLIGTKEEFLNPFLGPNSMLMDYSLPTTLP